LLENKYLCVMALFDEEANSKFRMIQKQLEHKGFKTPSVPPHITLGAYVGVEEKDLLNWVEEFCHTAKEFEINFTHLGLFSLNVLFLAPRVSNELINFHKNFHQKYDDDCGQVGYYYTLKSESWVPHASILIDEPEGILKALSIVNDNFKPFRGRIVSLSLCEFPPMRVIKTFYLK
jgi:2'-5' RNA ligase